jgi:hypothetical protein
MLRQTIPRRRPCFRPYQINWPPLYRLRTIWHHRALKTSPAPDLYKRHRFPAEIISHCVWRYFRFCLSYRDVEVRREASIWNG